jgi:hypothetical protein
MRFLLPARAAHRAEPDPTPADATARAARRMRAAIGRLSWLRGSLGGALLCVAGAIGMAPAGAIAGDG